MRNLTIEGKVRRMSIWLLRHTCESCGHTTSERCAENNNWKCPHCGEDLRDEKENNWDKIEKAVKDKLPDWYKECITYNPPGPGRITHLSELCPKCNQKMLYCLKNDFGRIDSEPHCAHIYINLGCDYSLATDTQGVSFPDLETSTNYCCLCEKEHPNQ